MNIQMVDLHGQYVKIKAEIDSAMQNVLDSSYFINGEQVSIFKANLEKYLEVKHVIPCANGTDALQVALMALNLPANSEILVPCFTYVATAEVIALLGHQPILVDVDPNTFNIDLDDLKQKLTPNSKAIVPVHLFGQCADMEPLMKIAKEHSLFVIEDSAQAIGAKYTSGNGSTSSAGCIGDFGTTSFFPSKNLGCYGDGGAIFTNDDDLAQKAQMICNHGQNKKYYHQVIGVNSRLDTLQASILNVKLLHLDGYIKSRQQVASIYDDHLGKNSRIQIPQRSKNTTHVFHQYTLLLKGLDRDDLQRHMKACGIPTMIYYPMPLNKQVAFWQEGVYPVTNKLCENVLSLPIHTEMSNAEATYIAEKLIEYIK